MVQDVRPNFWKRFKRSMRNLREEMYQNSAAKAGPSDDACCHKPVEELEKERERYRNIASQKRKH